MAPLSYYSLIFHMYLVVANRVFTERRIPGIRRVHYLIQGN